MSPLEPYGEFSLRPVDAASWEHLLCLHPAECAVQKRVIFTLAPRLWDRVALGADAMLIDLSHMLGIRTPWHLEPDIVGDLIKAGWAEELIHRVWQPGSRHCDITWEVGKWEDAFKYLVVGLGLDTAPIKLDVEERILSEYPPEWFMGYEDVFDRARTLQNENQDATWACALDVYMHLYYSADGLETRIPYPEEWEKGESFPMYEAPIARVYCPKSTRALAESLKTWRPEQIIFDYSLSQDWQEKDRSRLEQFVAGLKKIKRAFVPEIIPGMSNELYWCAMLGLYHLALSLEGVCSVNIVANAEAGFLNRPETAAVRQEMVQHLHMFHILEFLPSSGEEYNPKASVLYFGGQREKATIQTASWDELDPYHAAPPWFSGEGSYSWTQQVFMPAAPWTRLGQDPVRIKDDAAKFGKLIPLGELCEIHNGSTISALHFNCTGGVFRIDEEHLHAGRVELEEVPRVKLPADAQVVFLKPSDLLVAKTVKENGFVHVACFTSQERAIISDNLILLRIRDPRVSAPFLRAYLNWLTLTVAMNYGGHSALQNDVTSDLLAQVLVPGQPEQELEGWDQIDLVESDLIRRVSDIRLQIRDSFSSGSDRIFRNKLADIRRNSNLISASIKALERDDFQIANFYPFPIAYGYRLLFGLVDLRALYAEQLRVAENLLAFLASTALSLLVHGERRGVMAELKRYAEGGISPGHWRALVDRCCKAYQEDRSHSLAASINALQVNVTQKGFGEQIGKLIGIKNDFKHDRGPKTDDDFATACEVTKALLASCFHALAFFTDYPIHLVQDMDINRQGDQAILRCIRYMGDHPGLQQEQLNYPKPLKRGDLFLELGPQEWVPLYPFIAALHCPECKMRETYFIDKWDTGKGIIYYKSFERGHTFEHRQASVDLTIWGKDS